MLKKKLDKTIDIPEGVHVEITPVNVCVKGEKASVNVPIKTKRVTITQKDNQVMVSPKKKHTRHEKVMINTLTTLIKNAVLGVTEGYTYKLKVCSSHFPMNVSVKGKEVEVTNFMGEKNPRRVTLKEGADVSIEGEVITVTSADKGLAGQVAADIETLTKRPAFDKRVFMDGIFITEKAGVPLE